MQEFTLTRQCQDETMLIFRRPNFGLCMAKVLTPVPPYQQTLFVDEPYTATIIST